jgi:hypothetical protein
MERAIAGRVARTSILKQIDGHVVVEELRRDKDPAVRQELVDHLDLLDERVGEVP